MEEHLPGLLLKEIKEQKAEDEWPKQALHNHTVNQSDGGLRFFKATAPK